MLLDWVKQLNNKRSKITLNFCLVNSLQYEFVLKIEQVVFALENFTWLVLSIVFYNFITFLFSFCIGILYLDSLELNLGSNVHNLSLACISLLLLSDRIASMVLIPWSKMALTFLNPLKFCVWLWILWRHLEDVMYIFLLIVLLLSLI